MMNFTRLLMLLVVVAIAATLAGCGAAPVKVNIPVAVGCLGDVPARPVNTFGTGPYPGDKAAAQAALQDSSAWEGYATSLEAAMAGCEKKPVTTKEKQ